MLETAMLDGYSAPIPACLIMVRPCLFLWGRFLTVPPRAAFVLCSRLNAVNDRRLNGVFIQMKNYLIESSGLEVVHTPTHFDARTRESLLGVCLLAVRQLCILRVVSWCVYTERNLPPGSGREHVRSSEKRNQ